MMFHDPRERFVQTVVLPLNRLLEQREAGTVGRVTNQQELVELASRLYHFREHWSRAPTVDELIQRSDSYAVVREVSVVAKHRKATKFKPRYLDRADQISSHIVVDRYESTSGVRTDAHPETVLCTPAGELNLLDVVIQCANMWMAVLQDRGIFDGGPYAEWRDRPRDPNAPTRAPLMELVQGERYCEEYRLRLWRPEAERFEPMNLEGATFIGQLRQRPPVRLQGTIKRDDGPEVEVDVTLNEADSTLFRETDESGRGALLAWLLQKPEYRL